MYICSDCGRSFDEPGYRVEREVHAELDDRPVRVLWYPICPECGGEDYTEADYCDYCDEPVSLDALIGGCLCGKCLKEIICCRDDMVKAFFEEMPDMKDALAAYCHEHLQELRGGSEEE